MLAVLLLIVPILSKQLPLLREQLPMLADRLNTDVSPWLSKLGVNVALDPASIKAFGLKYLDANLEDWLATALSSARIGGSFLLAMLGNLFLVPMVLFYLLLDWNHLVARAAAMIPPRLRDMTDGFTRECDSMLGQYLRGQLLVMIVLAFYYSIGLFLFGFDLAVPVGVFTGLAVFIPVCRFRPRPDARVGLGSAAVPRLARVDRRGGGVRHRPSDREFLADAVAGRRTHRHEPVDRDLRVAGLRPPVRFRRRADRVAGQRGARGGRAAVARDLRAERPVPRMRQMPLAIGTPLARTFRNFSIGANAAALAHLQALGPSAAPVYLWGGSGVGQVAPARSDGRPDARAGRLGRFVQCRRRGTLGARRQLVAGTDRRLRPGSMLRSSMRRSCCSSRRRRSACRWLRPASCRRSICRCAKICAPRLGWGHVFVIRPLAESEARATLRRQADERGIFLSDDVMDYLLSHFDRDLKHLTAQLERLDAFSLATQRVVTVPLLRRMLTEEGAQ